MGDAVKTGSQVEVAYEDGTRRTFMIGDALTSNPAGGIISSVSPLAAAIMGAEAGETRTFRVKGGSDRRVTLIRVF